LICVKVQSTYFGLHNFATWTAHSAFWTAQNWLDCTVRICPATRHIVCYAVVLFSHVKQPMSSCLCPLFYTVI